MNVLIPVLALIGAVCAGGLHGHEGGLELGHGHISGHTGIAKVSYVKTPVVSTTYVKKPIVSYVSKPVKTISYVSKPVVSVYSVPVISHSQGGHGLELGGGYGGTHEW